MRNDIFACRVCGYLADLPPWGDDGATPLYDYCPCCGVEHGYQDATVEGAKRFRKEWIENGAKWEEPELAPNDWEIYSQLANIPAEFM